MPRGYRGRRKKPVYNWNDQMLENVIAGMRDEWFGLTGVDVSSMEGRLTGEADTPNNRYSDTPEYSMGCELAKKMTELCRRGKVFPNEEGALGRLILKEEASNWDYVADAPEAIYNAGSDGLDSVLDMFGL